MTNPVPVRTTLSFLGTTWLGFASITTTVLGVLFAINAWLDIAHRNFKDGLTEYAFLCLITPTFLTTVAYASWTTNRDQMRPVMVFLIRNTNPLSACVWLAYWAFVQPRQTAFWVWYTGLPYMGTLSRNIG